MSISNYRLSQFEKSIASLPDRPAEHGFSAQQLKELFDSRTDNEVKESINGIIDELAAPEGGTQIGYEGTVGANTLTGAIDRLNATKLTTLQSEEGVGIRVTQKPYGIRLDATGDVVPGEHSFTHMSGGEDEISLQGLKVKAEDVEVETESGERTLPEELDEIGSRFNTLENNYFEMEYVLPVTGWTTENGGNCYTIPLENITLLSRVDVSTPTIPDAEKLSKLGIGFTKTYDGGVKLFFSKLPETPITIVLMATIRCAAGVR